MTYNETVLRYPDACQFDEVTDDFDPSFVPSSRTMVHRDLLKEQERYLGSRSKYLTQEEELELAQQIQDGKAAVNLLADNPDVKDAELSDIVEAGATARRTLFAANARFAAFAARASMGIKPTARTRDQEPDSDSDTPGSQPGRSRQFKVGSYASIELLAHDGAEVEDRMQVAFEAMWKAAESFVPQYDAKGKSKCNFRTYSLWGIQGAISRHAIEKENSGWHTSTSTYDKLKGAELALEQGTHKPLRFNGADGHLREDKLNPKVALTGRHADSIERHVGHISEEATAYTGQIALTLSELALDSQPTAAQEVFERQRTLAIKDVLNTLSERESGVIALRFGLSDGILHSLDDIAKIYGISRMRIHQIESKAMMKLRHPLRSSWLESFVGELEDAYPTDSLILGSTNDTVLNLKVSHLEASGGTEVDAHAQGLYSFDPDDDWDAPLRNSPEDVQLAYDKAAEEFWGNIESEIMADWRSFVGKPEDSKIERLASQLLDNVSSVYAPILIERIWNNHLEDLIEGVSRRAEIAGVLDKVSLDTFPVLFNQLLARFEGSGYTFTLDIPSSLGGKLNRIGEGLRDSMLVINGDVGSYLGRRAGEESYIVVHGNAGDCVAAEATKDAQFDIHGSVGDFCGADVHAEDVGIFVDGDAGEGVAFEATAGKFEVAGAYTSALPASGFRGSIN